MGKVWRFTKSGNLAESGHARHPTGSGFGADHGVGGGGDCDLPKAEAARGAGIYFGWGGDWSSYATVEFCFKRGGDPDVGGVGSDSTDVFGRASF